MSLISRIEISNYLTEGLVSNRRVVDWSPMLTGITLSMAGGQSSLVNMTNGGGKTSMVELLLYVLSRDSRLLRRLRDKVAPKAKGFTHARIEFRSPADDTFRAPELLEPDTENLNGESRVIGVVLNDDTNDPPIFYSYSGTLEDSPCYLQDDSRILAVPDAEFVSRTRSIAGCHWNRHTSRREWEDHVGLFLPIEVVRRNVVYQLKGSDDQNASFFNFQTRGARSYDEAFFRSAIAPDLLTNLLNSWSDENETTIEDTLFNSLSRIVDAEREVDRKQTHLAAREAGIEQLRPILEAGRGVNKLSDERDNVLRSLSTSIALLHRFGAANSSRVLPGLPRSPSLLAKDATQDQRIGEAIRGMVLTAENGMVLLSTTLASLAKLSGSQLQTLAERNRIVAVPVGQRAIDVNDASAARQTARGGVRRGYAHVEAIELARLIARSAAEGADIPNIIEMAFDIAHAQIDTNPAAYRKRTLERQLGEKKAQREVAVKNGGSAQEKADQLSGQLESRQENQAAWNDFADIGTLLPSDVRTDPGAAKAWLDATFREHQENTRERDHRHGRLSDAWNTYCDVLDAAGIEGMAAVEREYEELTQERGYLEEEGRAVSRTASTVRATLTQAQQSLLEFDKKLETVLRQRENFDSLLPGYELFLQCFGDLHPDDVDPEADLTRLLGEIGKQQQARRQLSDELDELKEGHGAMLQYAAIFGDQDPRTTDPLAEDRSARQSLQQVAEQLAALAEPMKALNEFNAKAAGATPQTWMTGVDARRNKLAQAISERQDDIKEAVRELDALEQMTVLDDATYSEAWSVLAEAGIEPQRLFDVVQTSDFPPEMQRRALSALSGLLSAPVLECMADIRSAAECLDGARLSVPLVLRSALLEVIATGQSNASDSDADGADICGFLGGIYSHRLRVLAEPEYAEAEEARLTQQIIAYEDELHTLEAEIEPLAMTTQEYQCAMKALRAEKDRVPQTYKRLDAERRTLNAKLEDLRPRTEPQALQVLFDAQGFLQRGGVRRLEELDASVEAMDDQIQALELRKGEAEVRASFENLQALQSARKYVGLGGRVAHQTCRDGYVRACDVHDEAKCRYEDAREAAVALEDRESALRVRSGEFAAARSSERIAFVSGAIAFGQRSEDVDFMSNFQKASEDLAKRGNTLLQAMKVNFERAAAFLTLMDHSEQALQEALAEQRHLVQEYANHVRELDWTVNRLQMAEIPAWDRLRRAIHELSWELYARILTTQQAAVQLTSVEAGAGVAEGDPIYPLLDEVQSLLTMDALTSHDGVVSRVSEATAALAELDIDSRLLKLQGAQTALEKAESNFRNQNTAFCDGVRQQVGTQSSLFNQLELEQIERATPRSIESLSVLFERLGEVARKEREDAQRAQTVAQEANNDTLSQLAGLIRIAQDNLEALERVMARYPTGRFFVKAEIVSADRIAEILDDLKEEVERIAREGRERQPESTRSRRTQDETRIKHILRESLIERVFLAPQVSFVNAGIHGGRRQPVMSTLSTGQKIALEFMWIVRQAEYEIERGLRELNSRQAARSRARLHRVIFIDGIFSTLSDRAIIREALNGLRGLGGNFQIVGFLHSPTWVNDYSVFPVYHVGKKLTTQAGRGLVTFAESGREEGTVGFFSSIAKPRNDVAPQPVSSEKHMTVVGVMEEHAFAAASSTDAVPESEASVLIDGQGGRPGSGDTLQFIFDESAE